jgi:hypothetical protein
VLRPAGREEYLNQLGPSRIEALGVKNHAFSAAADFGY